MKLKNFLATLLSVALMLGMSVSAYANDIENVQNEKAQVASLQGNLLEQSEIKTVDVEQIASDETISVPKQRGGYVLNSIRGTVSGVLTTENPFDFYAFTKNTEFQGNIKFNTSEPNYTLTLGLLDYNTNQISLFSDIVLHPGNNFNINFVPLEEHLDYAWVVQSAGAYGASYSMTYDNDYDPTAFYIAPNGDKYSVRNQKMYLNNSMVSTDYRYDVSFSNQYGYQERHIWVEGANVRPIHVGAVEWYASKQRQYYDNVIILEVQPGGMFTHHFYQNPPYINWGHSDAYDLNTPRAFSASDISERGPHYLIYDINQGKTIQFASGLSANWTQYIGDLHSLRIP